ncbi:hypothetical protein [Pseudofulvibacter geojedonensis]|uniref:Uncharacterized protein n=1 Tax=Pseudofulvibacter geojedonensis TaxID=1123758 RepID=A0ABW3I5F8_9FLAO
MKKYIVICAGFLLFLTMSFILPNSPKEVNDCATYCAGYADVKVPNKKGDEQLKKWRKVYYACMKAKKCKKTKKVDSLSKKK